MKIPAYGTKYSFRSIVTHKSLYKQNRKQFYKYSLIIIGFEVYISRLVIVYNIVSSQFYLGLINY